MDGQNPMRWLAWELVKYAVVGIVAWLVILVLPGQPPRWLQFSVLAFGALATTVVIYRFRISKSRRGA